MAIINFDNKVALNENPNVPDINKCKDTDLNLIKQVGNQTINTLGLYTDNWSSTGTYAIGDIIIDDNRYFKNITGTNTATEPKNDTTNWEETTIILNEQSSSQINTYSCDYINGIIESGSNANGYYTKYADGTLICRYFVGPITTNANAGTTTAVTFPYKFINTDWQTQLTMTNGQSYWSYVFTNVSDKSKTGFNLKTWNNGGGTNSGQYFDYIAIGKWK